MPLQKLEFRPGLNREGTDYANEGGWYDGDKIRFRSGFPEKIGGWTRFSNNQYVGIARSLWNWQALDSTNYVGIGTSKKYYISKGSTYYDVTPYLNPAPASLTDPFSTVINSPTVTVTDPTYNPNVGDYVVFTSTASVGGLTISGEYTVTSVTGANTYTITASSNATSTVTNPPGGGGTVYAYYEYPIGLDVYTPGTGWGAGPWGGIASPKTQALGVDPFTTTASSTTVTVTQAAHGLTNGQYVSFSGATAVGGIPAVNLNKSFQITYVNANSYTIQSSPATSSTSGGGSSVIATDQTGTAGWGVAATGTIGEQLRLWSNDNFGQDLVLAPRGGPIYYWKATTGVSTRAQTLSSLATTAGYSGDYVPTKTNQVVASAIQKFVIAFGANSYVPGTPNTDFNPMLVRWSDQLNPYEWIPAVTNQSGEFALTNGSYIVGAKATRQEILVWTDSALYSMQYLGAPYVWGFNILMDNISVMSPNSMITVNNVTYWMGVDKFYMYSGRVETLPCSLRQYIFEDINLNQSYQVFAGSNEGFNEVWWFYVSDASADNTVDKYVIYNYVDRVWYYGTMARTAWLDSGILNNPIAANYDGRLLNHEDGNDDVSGLTPVAFNAYVQSSDFDINDGHNFGFVWRILPDVNFNGSSTNNPAVTMTIKPRVNSGTAYGQADNPKVTSADNYSNTRVYNIQKFTGQVYTRLRGRQLSFRIESGTNPADIGVSWQLGCPRIDIRPDGRR